MSRKVKTVWQQTSPRVMRFPARMGNLYKELILLLYCSSGTYKYKVLPSSWSTSQYHITYKAALPYSYSNNMQISYSFDYFLVFLSSINRSNCHPSNNQIVLENGSKWSATCIVCKNIHIDKHFTLYTTHCTLHTVHFYFKFIRYANLVWYLPTMLNTVSTVHAV